MGRGVVKGLACGAAAWMLMCFVATQGRTAQKEPPATDGKAIVATVDKEPITWEELNAAMEGSTAAEGKETKEEARARRQTLDRLITAKLILQEARRIGLDELDDVRQAVQVFEKVSLRDLLIEMQVKGTQVTNEELEPAYKEIVKEWRVTSLLFQDEGDAKALEAEVKNGRSFDELVEAAVKKGSARGGKGEGYVKPDDMLPEVAAALAKLDAGQVSPPIKTASGHVVARIDDVRFPEDSPARERLRRRLLPQKTESVAQDYEASLEEKYAKVNRELLDALDYEKDTATFQSLLEDQRTVAEVEGEDPVTVADLTREIDSNLYHGIETAVRDKLINQRKALFLHKVLLKRVLRKEALRQGLDKTDEYKKRVKEYEDSLVFGAFLRKVIQPEIKVEEKEVESHYREHLPEYSSPEMLRTECIAFTNGRDAEAALEKLRQGTDLGWLKSNADGLVERGTQGLLECEGTLAARTSLPEGVSQALEGVRKGDLRLYASPEGWFYVFRIEDFFQVQPQPYEAVKRDIERKLFDARVKGSIEDWGKKLREATDVKVYLADPGK